MFYIISFLLIIIAYHLGKFFGIGEGESKTYKLHYYLYAPQIDKYEQGFKDGEQKTQERFFNHK